MPKIMKEDKQIKALSEISAALSEIELINSALSGRCKCNIMVETESRRMARVAIDAKDTKRLHAIIRDRKAYLVKTIRNKAAKFRIELDDKELESMEDIKEAPAADVIEAEEQETSEDTEQDTDPSDVLSIGDDFPP